MVTPSLRDLAQWAIHEADMVDAMGPTPAGDKLRLIGAVLTKFETELLPALEHLNTEIRRLEIQAHVAG